MRIDEHGRRMASRLLRIRLLVVSLLFVYSHASLAEPACSASHFDVISKIRYIHDGDTLHLVDGHKIRLTGINTPELAHDDKPAQPFAYEARDALKSLFSTDKSIALVYGNEKQDRYGRVLAHAFLTDGQNVQAILLKRGFAHVINVPPNTQFSSCYLEMEDHARCNREGLWKNKVMIEADKLDGQAEGFHLVKGNIINIDMTDKGIWLNLDNKLTAGIRPGDWSQFDIKELKKMLNQIVIVRGWINKSNRSTPYYMRLRHPLSLQPYSTLSCMDNN